MRFATDAPAIRLGNEQYISYLGDNSIRTYGSAASHSLSTQIDGIVRFSYGTHGDISIYGDGVANALTLHGQYVAGFDFSGVDFAGSTILLKSGQDIAWEPSRTVHTSFSNGALTDQVASGVGRTLDTDGNEKIPGSMTSAQSVVKINNATGSAYASTGTALVGLDTTGLTATDAVRMAQGQSVSWEPTAIIRTSFSNGKLTDSMGAGNFRALDTGGNEALSGTHNAAGGYVLPSMTTAQIKALTNTVNALVVYDTDTHTPVIHVDGVWYKINLGDSL